MTNDKRFFTVQQKDGTILAIDLDSIEYIHLAGTMGDRWTTFHMKSKDKITLDGNYMASVIQLSDDWNDDYRCDDGDIKRYNEITGEFERQ